MLSGWKMLRKWEEASFFFYIMLRGGRTENRDNPWFCNSLHTTVLLSEFAVDPMLLPEQSPTNISHSLNFCKKCSILLWITFWPVGPTFRRVTYSPQRKAPPPANSTWTPLLDRNCLKSAIFRSPTRTGLCGEAAPGIGSRDLMSLSVFPTSESTQATSESPSWYYFIILQRHWLQIGKEEKNSHGNKRYLLEDHIAHQLFRKLDLMYHHTGLIQSHNSKPMS